MRHLAPLAIAFAAVAFAAPAHAGELFGGLYKHAVDTPLSLDSEFEGGADVQLGYRFDGIGGSRFQPYVFGALNTAGDTSYAAAGVSYKTRGRVYFRPGLGLAVHNGSTRDFSAGDRIDFGSRLLIEPEINIGTDVNDRLSIEASWVHMSHATGLSRQNPGIDNIGVRLNWRL